MREIISEFEGRRAFLSNFHASPFVAWPLMPSIVPRQFDTVEHWFQAHKAITDFDFELVRGQSTPGKAKRMGRQIDLRIGWDEVAEDVMLAGLLHKFTQNLHLGERLLDTQNALLVEGNTWGDRLWGAVEAEGKPGPGDEVFIIDGKRWHGRNELGRLLMQVRRILGGEGE